MIYGRTLSFYSDFICWQTCAVVKIMRGPLPVPRKIDTKVNAPAQPPFKKQKINIICPTN